MTSSSTSSATLANAEAEALKFRLGIKWSLIAHVALALMGWLIGWIQGIYPFNQPLPYIPTLKVDLVALPDSLKKDTFKKEAQHQEIEKILKQAEKNANKIKSLRPLPQSKQAEIAQPDEMVIHPKDHPDSTRPTVIKKNKLALARIKALAKIQELNSERPQDTSSVLIRGNKLSPGTSLSNDAREAALGNYFDSLRDRLQENWTLPTWVSRQSFSAQVQVYINAKGKLQGFKFMKLSGNPQFDEAVKKALQESQPFPFPPKELVSYLMSDGILVGFPL